MIGDRLRATAERLFDRTTLDRVILPAVADLRHECDAPGATRTTRLRACWAVIKTIGVCVLRDTVTDRHHAGRAVAARMLITLAIVVSLLVMLPFASWLVNFGATFGVRAAVISGALLAVQAVAVAVPIALLFALALDRPVRRRVPRPSGTLTPVALASSVAGVLVMWTLMETGVPTANQAYREFVFATYSGNTSTVALRKGPPEMTWRELADHIRDAPTVAAEANARNHRLSRLALVVSVPILCATGVALANRRRSRLFTIFAATAAVMVWLACAMVAEGRLGGFNGPWVGNAAVMVLTLLLFAPRGLPAVRVG